MYKQRETKRKQKNEQKKEKSLLHLALLDLTKGADSVNCACTARGFPIYMYIGHFSGFFEGECKGGFSSNQAFFNEFPLKPMLET